MTSGPEEAGPHANLQHWLSFFCSSAVTEASLGVIKPLSAEEACGFLGCMVVETGEPELENLDVIEAGSGAGRWAMQYTGVRRSAYDEARLQAIAEDIDPNSNSWQEQYFAQEYAGLHDPPEGSLIGWTRVFEERPHAMDPAAAAAYWTGSAAAAEGVPRQAPWPPANFIVGGQAVQAEVAATTITRLARNDAKAASALSLDLAGRIVTVLDCGIEDLLEVIEI